MIKCKDCKYWINGYCERPRIDDEEGIVKGDYSYIKIKGEEGNELKMPSPYWNAAIIHKIVDANYSCIYGKKYD